METDTLPDTGGHYYDKDTGGISGIIWRNTAKAKAHITSGDAAPAMLATALGFLAAGAISRYTGMGD